MTLIPLTSALSDSTTSGQPYASPATTSGEAAAPEVTVETVDYSDEKGTVLEGRFIYPKKGATGGGPLPGVILVHDWRGISDVTVKRGEMVAALGYAVLLADVYGKGIHPQSVPEYVQESTIYKSDRPLFRERLRAAYVEMKKHSLVRPDAIAAIGYCFGGTGVMEMARDGLPLRGVVSFHGGLDSSGVSNGSQIKTKVLALCGADDPFEKPDDFAAFEEELRANQVDYQIVKYGHAEHSFTDWESGKLNLPGAAYNQEADRRSWQHMADFFAEIFGKS